MVYVDALITYSKKFGPSCHMVADTIDELNDFALLIGLKLEWADTKGDLYHFDLTPNKRALAVKKGAKELDRYQFANFYNKHKTLNEETPPANN